MIKGDASSYQNHSKKQGAARLSCYVIQSYSDIECDGGITSYANGQNGSATSRIRPTTFGPEAPGKETAMQTEEPDTPGSKTLKPGSKDPDTELAQKIKNELRDQLVLVSTDGPHDSVIKTKPPLIFNRGNAQEVVEKMDLVLQSI